MACKYRKAVTVKDEFGKSRRVYVGSNDPDELDKKVTELKYLTNKGVSISSDNLTIKQLGEMWFKLKQTKNAETTKKRNRGILDNYIYEHLGHIPVKSLKAHHIDTLINSQLESNKTDTIRKTYQIVNSILDFAVNNDYVYKNVAKSIDIPRFVAKEKAILSSSEKLKIEQSSNKYRDFFVFLLYTGLRRGEIAALEWKDIDLVNRTILVNKAISFDTNKGTLKTTKNKKSRIVPILDNVYDIIQRQDKTSKYVFHKKDNDHLSETAIKRMLESFILDTGVTFSLHQLRHTFCTILYYAGISSKKAQEIMGHSSIDVTLKIYTHLDNEKENDTIDKLNNYLKCQ